jgi:hypothetical protein
MRQRCKAISGAVVRGLVCTLCVAWGTGIVAGQKLTVQPQPVERVQASSTSGAASLSAQEFARAQAAAQQILAGAEFQREPPTLWDRIKEKIGEALVRLFVGIDRVTTRSPWMGRALEWLLFAAAAVGLLVWGLRTVQRQRMRVALGGAPIQTAARARERDDWWRLAEVEAAKGAWREAIHAVYWAAIVHLENRRAWRHNPARTPREYVRLLKPGSAEQRELRGLTGALEKSWYGQQETRENEFQAARESFERLAAGADASAVNAGRAGLAGDGA